MAEEESGGQGGKAIITVFVESLQFSFITFLKSSPILRLSWIHVDLHDVTGQSHGRRSG